MQNKEQVKVKEGWPKKRRLIGTKVQRIDGADKATGRARYSFDINRPGMLHAVMLRSPHAHCVLESLDVSAAQKMPGVKAIVGASPDGKLPAPGREYYYAGDEILALAADTEEHAQDALRAVKISFKVLDHLVLEEDVLKNPKKKTLAGAGDSNLIVGQEFTRGDVEKAYKEADAVHEGEYGVATQCHHCLEPHGLVAEWSKDPNTQDDFLTVWASTQAVVGTAQQLAQTFKLKPNNVRCITHYMGGGFGSKFGPDIQGIVAALLARQAGAPVKLMLPREDEITCAGNRPSAYAKVKIAGKKDGTITAYEVDCYGTPGVAGSATVNLGLLPYPYETGAHIPNIKRKHTIVRTNCGGARAFRAPGHPQNCMLTECAVDDLAAKLGLDPMQVRLKNLPPSQGQDPINWAGVRHKIYTDEINIAAKLANWSKKWHPPGKGPDKGPIKHGIGMAIHTWGGGAQGGDPPNNECTVIISRDGSVTALSSTQDLGTCQRTLTALVTAEILGLKASDITVKIGENQFGRSTGSGGSTTAPSQAPATLFAARAALDDLFTKIAPKLGAKKEDLAIEPEGKIVDRASKKTYSWKEACARLGMEEAKGQGGWSSVLVAANPGISNVQVGGVQIAEVAVDTETGVVKVTQVVAVQDVGMVVNLLACESQVAGGVIMGVNYALFEERLMDRTTGRQVNADMEFYKLGGIADMPKIIVHMHDMPERGVIGIGEPPTISTAAAISNAIFNAIGVRVPHTPFTPDKVLAALAKRA